MQTKNILFVARSFQMGGQEKISASILEYLADNGYHITCFACVFSLSFMSENLEKKGIVFHTGTAFELYKLMKSSRFDAVYMCAEFYSAIVLMMSILCGINVRITHTHQTQSETKWFKLLIKNHIFRPIINMLATQRLACSNAAGEFLYGKGQKFEWVKNGIDIQKFSFYPQQREEMRHKLGVENKFVVGHIGRLHSMKNQLFLIDIIAELRKRKPTTVFLLAGKGDLKNEINDKIQRLNLKQSFVFVGETDSPSFLYQAMDCFILPSLKEGFGLVAIEAECSGLPCFISDGVPDDVMICNTTKIPLSKSAEEWAEIILNTTKDFIRKDCSAEIKKAGFDIKDTTKQIVKDFLQ